MAGAGDPPLTATTRHAASLRARKRIEEAFGGIKTFARLRRTSCVAL